MRILYATQAFPYPPDAGHSIRLFEVLKALAKVGDVTLLSFCDLPQKLEHQRALRPFCRQIILLERKTLLRKHYDVIHRRQASVAGRLRAAASAMRAFAKERMKGNSAAWVRALSRAAYFLGGFRESMAASAPARCRRGS